MIGSDFSDSLEQNYASTIYYASAYTSADILLHCIFLVIN